MVQVREKPVTGEEKVTEAKKKVDSLNKVKKAIEEKTAATKKQSSTERPDTSEREEKTSPKEEERPRSTEPRDLTKAQTLTGRLIVACKRNDWITVETYLKHLRPGSIDVHLVTETGGWTPVHFAAKENRVLIVERLLDLGYNVNAKSRVSTLTCDSDSITSS